MINVNFFSSFSISLFPLHCFFYLLSLVWYFLNLFSRREKLSVPLSLCLFFLSLPLLSLARLSFAIRERKRVVFLLSLSLSV